MIDELDEMGRANPVTPDALDQAVAIDRSALLDLLEADGGDRRRRLTVLGGGPPRGVVRAGYVGAMVAAAAAVVAVALFGADDPAPPADVVESAEEMTSTTPLVVEDLDQDGIAVSTTAPGTGSNPDNQAVVVTTETSATTDGADAGQAGEGMAAPVPDGPFHPAVDLLTLHYDHAHLDDGHAAVAARELATAFDIDPHVVSGTHAIDGDGDGHDFAPVMQAAWGDRWLDATTDRPGAVSRSVERWLATLDAGGRVWVAEGGVSDFTAEVVREIRRRRPDLDTEATIHVVQHADRNESETGPENLRFVRSTTAYERIDDGNDANGTADLNQPSDAFERLALAGRHRAAWSVAFEYLPAAQLDFSDTVEVLHILGVGIDEVADPDGFARRVLR